MIRTVEKNDIIADFRQGLNNSEIAEKHNRSRTTIVEFRKQYDQALSAQNPEAALAELIRTERVPSKRNRPSQKLSPEIKAIIDAALDDNKVKRATGRRKMVKRGTDIYEDILKAGYKISYRTVRRYIEHQGTDKPSTVLNCFIRQAYVPGERMEFDWGEVKIFINGNESKFNMGAMSLCCNARWARLSTRQDKQAMMEAHAEAFAFFGRVPHVMVYDNMRTAVKSFTTEGKEPTVELSQLKAYYGFSHLFCNVCSGNEKGHVERSVEVIRRKAFGGRDHFDSLDEANKYLLDWCKQNNESVKEAFEEELKYMRPAETPYSCYEGDWRKVGKEALFSLDTNEYSVPFEYVGKNVWVRKYADKICIYDNNGNSPKLIAEHARNHDREQQTIDLQHYLPVLKAKPGALKNSVALKQTPESLQALYNRHFADSSRSFIEMLLWANEKGYSYQEICSAALLAETNGVTHLSFDAIKAVMNQYEEVISAIELPWSEGIEKSTQKNLDILGSLFHKTNVSFS